MVHYPPNGTLRHCPFVLGVGSIPLWPPCRLPKQIVSSRNNDHNEQFKLSMTSLYTNLLLRVKWGFWIWYFLPTKSTIWWSLSSQTKVWNEITIYFVKLLMCYHQLVYIVITLSVHFTSAFWDTIGRLTPQLLRLPQFL